jgi:hypothetical protein
MTVYEFVTELERRVDYWRSRGRQEHHPVVVFAAPGRFWGSIPVRPKVIGKTADGLTRYQFTMNQARRVADIIRGRE